MPHFTVDCSENVFSLMEPQSLAKAVHEAALSTELFAEANIQVKVRASAGYLVGGKKEDFISVFASILEGRTTEQKSALSKAVVTKLYGLLPQVPHIHTNVTDLQKGTDCNQSKL